ncbi:hypothetical protein M5K25_021549 [Dendrobium thyrsiflorum]|uniref:Uncharacterized protein n=1 Tax=Dendrobium thyrsiflorum TaxID=117978 RepID=A0ABD0UCR1_DENTH
MATQQSIPFIVLLLLLHHAECLRLGQWGTLISLSHSLINRVANARAARGDQAAADRARKIADKIHSLGSIRGIWSAGSDFAWNYAFRGGIPSAETYRSASEIMALLAEFYRLESAEERAGWMRRKYSHLFDRSKSLFQALLRSFSRSGVLRELVLVMQKEVVDGDLLRDCLEVGAADLEGLLRVASDMFFSSSWSHNRSLSVAYLKIRYFECWRYAANFTTNCPPGGDISPSTPTTAAMSTQQSMPFIVLQLLHHAKFLRLGQWGTLIYLSHSLMNRVADTRSARGDQAAADRARKIAEKIHSLGSVRGIWSVGSDFAWNYAFRGGIPSAEIYRFASEIMALLAEFYRLESAEERSGWMLRKYSHLFDRSKSLFQALLRSFSRSAVLREAVLVIQKEVVDGELLRDCLEVGAADLEVLVRVARDMFFSSSSSRRKL